MSYSLEPFDDFMTFNRVKPDTTSTRVISCCQPMIRSAIRCNSRVHFSVSRCNKNYRKELETLFSSNVSSDKGESKPQSNPPRTNTEDSLKKLFENFSQKNKKYPTTGFRPILRKNPANERNTSNKSTLSDSLKKSKIKSESDPKYNLLIDKIPNNLHNLVVFLSERLPKNVLVHNHKAPHLSNFMTNYQALNTVDWNEQGIKILRENLTTESLKNIGHYKDLYFSFPKHALVSVIQIVPKGEMPVQQFNVEMKKQILQDLGSDELLAKIQTHEDALKKKALREKSAPNFKVLKVNWECQPKDMIRKVRIADRALRAGEKVEFVFGPEFYLASPFFRTAHHPVISEYTRSKIGGNAIISDEETFLQDINRLFESRGYNKRMSTRRRNELAQLLLDYLEETEAKFKVYGSYTTLKVISVHSAKCELATEQTLKKKVGDDQPVQKKNSHSKGPREKGSREKKAVETNKKTKAPQGDMYSMKIVD